MKKKLSLNESKERTFKLMHTLNENFVSPVIEQTPNTQKLERFLSDLGYNQMFYQYKKDPRQLERVFSKLLKGRNLATFQKLMQDLKSPEDKARDIQQQKDDKANQEFQNKKIQYEAMVEELKQLKPMQLLEKYMEVFHIPSERQMELYSKLLSTKQYSDPDYPEIGSADLDMFEEVTEEWIEKIATKLVYGGDEKPF